MTKLHAPKTSQISAKTEMGGKGEGMDIVLSFGDPIDLRKAFGDHGYLLPVCVTAGLGAFQREDSRGLDAIHAFEMTFSIFGVDGYARNEKMIFINLALNKPNETTLYLCSGETASAVIGCVQFIDGRASVPLYVRDISTPVMPMCSAVRLLKEMRVIGKTLFGDMGMAARGARGAMTSLLTKSGLRCG